MGSLESPQQIARGTLTEVCNKEGNLHHLGRYREGWGCFVMRVAFRL
jgi:hypothetical protein